MEKRQQQQEQRRSSVTLADLWTFYLDEHAKPHKRSWRVDQQRYDRHMGQWKDWPLSEIDDGEIQALLNRVGKKSGHYEANRLRSLLHKMFALSHRVGFDGRNPVHGIERFPEESRERFLHADELPRFFAALAELRIDSPTAADALELCLWTGPGGQHPQHGMERSQP